MPIITTLFFDLDGTLIDSNPVIVSAWLAMGEKYHVTISPEQIDQHIIGASAGHTLATLFGQFSPTQQEEIHQQVDDIEEVAPTQLIAGAKEFLYKVRGLGLRCGLVTSSWPKKIDHVLKHHEINVFDHIVCRNDVQKGKPHPEPYLLACQKFGIEPSQALTFEDSLSGIQSAKASGISCIAINQPSLPHVVSIPDFRSLAITSQNFLYALANEQQGLGILDSGKSEKMPMK